MEAKQSSSVFDSLAGRMDTINEENKELNIVTALTTPLHPVKRRQTTRRILEKDKGTRTRTSRTTTADRRTQF
jgi:hypothetical protein